MAGPLGIAVSGGGDSLGLLYIAVDWARARGRALHALTLDHGIRPEAAAEAAFVADECARLGVPHQILRWQPPAGHVSQGIARRARYTLLSTALRDVGGQYLLMGHTLDDQLETYTMRAARAGAEATLALAGMRSVSLSPVWPAGRGVFLARPCLDVSRAALRAYLKSKGAGWIEDPTNQDRTYERVRVRQDLAKEMPEGVLRALSFAGAARAKSDKQLARWFAGSISAGPDGLITIGDVDGLAPDVLAEGLAWLLMVAAGTDKRPDRKGRLELAHDILRRFKTFDTRTLGGAWIAPRKGQIYIAREPPRKGYALPAPKEGEVWDGRFLIRSLENSENQANIDVKLLNIPHIQDIPFMARATYPAIEGTNLVADCLIAERIETIAFGLDCENLIKCGI